MSANPVSKGLEGVVAAETRLSMVDGEAGELVIAGFPLVELAEHAKFEETAWLLWGDRLPDAESLKALGGQLRAARALPEITQRVLADAAAQKVGAMTALRMASGTLPVHLDARPLINGIAAEDWGTAIRLFASFPTIVASYARIVEGKAPIAPRSDLDHAANFLYMLTGEVPGQNRVRGLETYLNTVVDHGLNASTFTARVIVSTGSDFVSAIAGAVGALKGPLHGGAPGPALDMVFAIGSPENAEAWLRKHIEGGERLMGFGHRVYKVRDPRADVLAAAAERMYTTGGDMALYNLARSVEQTALRLLEEYKPGRKLQTNVEYYTALLLHGLGLPTDLFTPVFAISRVVGWIAHSFEQRRAGRLIRPQSVYTGPRDRRWVALDQRAGAMMR